MKAYCDCGFEIEKPQWEHLVYAIWKQGGHAGRNICPKCKKERLEFDFMKENRQVIKT